MNARQILTGTLLTASLVVGGTGIAGAGQGSRPAMDRGTVDCVAVADQLTNLVERHDRLVDRVFALETERDTAAESGQTRKAARLQDAVDRGNAALARVDARIERLRGIYNTSCSQGT